MRTARSLFPGPVAITNAALSVAFFTTKLQSAGMVTISMQRNESLMPFPKQTQITYWSASRFGTYQSCPFKAKLLYLDKLPMEKSVHMDRGNDIHKLAEGYLKGAIVRIPPELKKFEAEFKRIRAYKKKKPHLVTIEETYAFRKDWSLTVFNDWAECWLRIKMDCDEIIPGPEGQPISVVSDWKTGKFRPDSMEDYIEQMDLYALGSLLKHQDLVGLTVLPRLVYLDVGVIFPRTPEETKRMTYTHADTPSLKKLWTQKTKAMLNDKKFAPKPNQWCYSCQFRAAAGGPCKY